MEGQRMAPLPPDRKIRTKKKKVLEQEPADMEIDVRKEEIDNVQKSDSDDHEIASTENSDSLDASYTGFDSAADRKVKEVALDLSYRSSVDAGSDTAAMESEGINPFDGASLTSDPRLDPKSPSFDSKYWIRNMKKMMDSDPEHFKPTSLGVAFKDLRAYGKSADADYQSTVLNVPFKLIGEAWDAVVNRNDTSQNFDILKPMDGLLKKGSLTVVLGRPGAGCTTFLKTISAHTHGFHIDKNSIISYDGITPSKIRNNYRGDVTYSAEADIHFPHLTVGQTLEFAARLRTPQNRPHTVSREDYARRVTEVYMAMYGLSHTYNTNVGNDFVRGVSGGERKRVSIAEVSLCGSYLQCWDNATRGLDSATALEFVRALRTQADVMDITSLVAIYQCSQDAYDLFDNCILLYEGYQVYSGPASQAKDYFLRMGYECPARQTTADFLTSLTNPAERTVRKGFSKKVPHTPKQFYDYWNQSTERKRLVAEVDEYIDHCRSDSVAQEFAVAHRARQSNYTSKKSSFTVSFWMQIRALMHRNWLRTKGAPAVAIAAIVSNVIIFLIISSLYYNLPNNTGSFYTRGAAMFLGVLFNCFASLLEIIALFEARPLIEKHKQYALYHPSAEALASILFELPSKIIICVLSNLVFYFMVNFRREPGAFFYYLLMCLIGTISMSHLFRSLGSFYHSLSAAMTPATFALLLLCLYTGFALPTTSMHQWSRWIAYVNPISYVFESLMANEFHDREWPCSVLIPSGLDYANSSLNNQVCSVLGSVNGRNTVNGDTYIQVAYQYFWSHRWRNFGVVVAYATLFLITYLVACELNSGSMQKGEITLFPRSKLRRILKQKKKNASKFADVEAGGSMSATSGLAVSQEIQEEQLNKIESATETFHWRDVCYDIEIGSEKRRILSNVDGWIKPGQLTALMGASGAGKTTLLDVLASRVTMGTIYGHIFVNGHPRDASFQRSTGYAQQQDLHLQTSTVREALRFSAYLRQPEHISKSEKNDYVESVISILEMGPYADAVVGVPGEGLNVEQRKRLTIGVELAAKPKLLVFLDEPTSGLDSQTAWSVCQLMRKLANHGQAVLCTIHQPSAILIQEFDRLLFLAKGGRTVYFGDLGVNASKLITYFESHGAPKCPPAANPVEWMLEVIGAAPGSHADQDYHEVWRNSKQYRKVQRELKKMERELAPLPRDESTESRREFASNFSTQYYQVTKRVFELYYRTPVYIWSKLLLVLVSVIFNGFTFYNAGTSLQGLQNQMLSTFMFLTPVNALCQQMMPHFLYQRSIYEVRERHSKTFGWLPWILSQITAEVPWQILTGTVAYLCWMYPVGYYHNMEPTHAVSERSGLLWLLSVTFYIWITTFGHLCMAPFDGAELGGTLVSFFYTLAINFCGILRYPTGFWVWLYRVSPLTYLAQSFMATALGNTNVQCAANEFVKFPAPNGELCGDYMSSFINSTGGYLSNPNAVNSTCLYCTTSSTNVFLKSIHSDFDLRWQNWGIAFCYIFINIFLTILLYWLVRVPKGDRKVDEQPPPQVASGLSSEISADPVIAEDEEELQEINPKKTKSGHH